MLPSLPLRPAAGLFLCQVALAGCALPAPYSPAPQSAPATQQPEAPEPQIDIQPATPPQVVAPSEPLATPPTRERNLNPAARALISQAQAQTASGNYAIAASTLERALRIEPDSAQVWIEMGKVRQAEGNYGQAENMGRKALSLATGDPRSQAAAWRIIADSLRSRNRVQEAREADVRAEALTPN